MYDVLTRSVFCSGFAGCCGCCCGKLWVFLWYGFFFHRLLRARWIASRWRTWGEFFFFSKSCSELLLGGGLCELGFYLQSREVGSVEKLGDFLFFFFLCLCVGVYQLCACMFVFCMCSWFSRMVGGGEVAGNDVLLTFCM